MNLKEKFPLLMWFLGRSVLYYALTAFVFMGSVEFYLMHNLRLKQLQQMNFISGGKNPYTAISHYEYLIQLGAADKDLCLRLAARYLAIGDQRGAADAYKQALKRVAPQSKEYQDILNVYRHNIGAKH